MNYIESFPYLIIGTIVSGLYYPMFAIVGVWGVLAGRLIFVVGYKKGAQYRMIGALTMMLLNLMMLCLSIASGIMYLTN